MLKMFWQKGDWSKQELEKAKAGLSGVMDFLRSRSAPDRAHELSSPDTWGRLWSQAQEAFDALEGIDRKLQGSGSNLVHWNEDLLELFEVMGEAIDRELKAGASSLPIPGKEIKEEKATLEKITQGLRDLAGSCDRLLQKRYGGAEQPPEVHA